MPARAGGATRAVVIRTGAADGLLIAPIGSTGRWAALRALHQAMQRLRENGSRPSLSFVIAIAEDGRIVPGRDPSASVFLLGYRST
jgi:hypothetical protein